MFGWIDAIAAFFEEPALDMPLIVPYVSQHIAHSPAAMRELEAFVASKILDSAENENDDDA